MTILYDKSKECPISGYFEPYYIVDGKRPQLEKNIVELTVVSTPAPPISDFEVATYQWIKSGSDYVQTWTVVKVPVNWHLLFPLRVKIPNATMQDWISKKDEHNTLFETFGVSKYPEIIALIDYSKNFFPKEQVILDGDALYLYATEVFEKHRAILIAFGAFVQEQPK
jgi:hypothetical protein